MTCAHTAKCVIPHPRGSSAPWLCLTHLNVVRWVSALAGKQQLIIDDQGAGGGEAAAQLEDPEAGECQGDPAYAHLTHFMVAFCRKVDDLFRNINEQISQLRDETLCRPRQPAQVQVQIPPPAVFHQVLEQPLPSPSMVPRLASLRRDPTLMRQVNSLVDGLDSTVSGMMLDKFSKQGWARSGGDLAPRVPTPWPQDHIMGQGRNSKLYYDDLNIYEWSQGILAIIEAEEDINVMRFMLSHYRAVYRDAQNHGFAAARWSKFFNNGSCPHSSHHDNGLTRWRHVCRECWELGHTIRECTTN
jgi:hypothetical protein